MVIKHLLFFIILIIILYTVQSQNNQTNETQPLNTQEEEISSIPTSKNEFEAIFRIDSLFNNYSLAVQDDDIFFSESKTGNQQNFLITSTFFNSYYIIFRKDNKRLGIDEENRIHLYKIDEQENIDKTYWNIIPYNNIPNTYLIQNVFNQKFLEIKTENNKLRCKDTLEYDPNKKIDNIRNEVKFRFFKLYEEVQIRPIDIKMVNRQPIDIFMKYTDYTDKTLNRTGINEKRKENDMEELRYSIRSILKYIPWIRKIFIVMPNKKVRYFKPIEEIKDKFVYIKDKDLIGFDTMNSAPIQFNLFKLEKYGISENFIYMDDNYFIGGDLKKTDFFYYDDKLKKVLPAIVNGFFSELNEQATLNEYNEFFKGKDTFNVNDNLGWKFSILCTEKLIIDNYNIPLVNLEFTHNALPLNINELKEIYTLITKKYEYVNETLYSLERNIFALQPQLLFSLYGLNIKKRKVHYIEYNHLGLNQIQKNYLYTKLVGINTGGDEFTLAHEKGKIILGERFSEPTKYENDFEEKKIIKEEEQSSYINKTELKIIEDLFKSELLFYVIIYWGLIISISVVLIIIIYYFFDLNKKSNFCKRYTYNKIRQEDIRNI